MSIAMEQLAQIFQEDIDDMIEGLLQLDSPSADVCACLSKLQHATNECNKRLDWELKEELGKHAQSQYYIGTSVQDIAQNIQEEIDDVTKRISKFVCVSHELFALLRVTTETARECFIEIELDLLGETTSLPARPNFTWFRT